MFSIFCNLEIEEVHIRGTQVTASTKSSSGPTITDHSGTPGHIWNGEVVAGNETIQGQLLKAIKAVK